MIQKKTVTQGNCSIIAPQKNSAVVQMYTYDRKAKDNPVTVDDESARNEIYPVRSSKVNGGE